jgi:hypothetical protein
MRKSTSRLAAEILPGLLNEIEKKKADNPNAIIACWKEIISPELLPMTKAVSFKEGALFVKVKSSTLYSLLCQYEKKKLLKKMQKKFSKEIVRNIIFKLG